MNCIRAMLIPLAAAVLLGCEREVTSTPGPGTAPGTAVPAATVAERLEIYAPVRLTADLSALSADQRSMLNLLIQAADVMDSLFWLQAYGEPGPLLDSLESPSLRRFAQINYGPWDRLADDVPFVPGVGPKPPGANFYPPDMSIEEFEAAELEGKRALYTLLQRAEDGTLRVVPYHQAYAAQLAEAAGLLEQAAALAEDEAFAEYLRLRAAALKTDEYQASDLAWLDVENNRIELVIGAIETYEDQLLGYKAAYEAYVLLKDPLWSASLARYAEFLPQLQRSLPVAEAYKRETPGTDSDLNAYDVLYYAGHSNAGSKTIAINLPNDEQVQLARGTRRLQLKNAMRAKFDRILVPIADVLIVEEQRRHVTFEAFFGNTMFHEVAHGLGIKNVLGSGVTVREALKDMASSIEEGKADVLGLYLVSQLRELDQVPEGELMDNYVTFLASIFRSVRFGASSAHGRANMLRFNFFQDRGAFSRDPQTGRYRVDRESMAAAVDELSRRILVLQGDGDYAGARQFTEELGVVGPQLEQDLGLLAERNIPVDIVFEQGPEVLGL